jgi:hypothetical protein
VIGNLDELKKFFLLFITFEISIIYQFQLCFSLNSPDNIRIVNTNKIEVPHDENLTK